MPTQLKIPPPEAPSTSNITRPCDRHLKVTLQEDIRSPGTDYLLKSTHTLSPREETRLLKAVQSALRGQDAVSPGVVQSSWLADEDNPDGREIVWNAKEVVLCVGGAIVKRWSFFQEKEDIQYACLGLLEQNALEDQRHFNPSNTQGSVAEDDEPSSTKGLGDSRPTFGPFAQLNFQRRKFPDKRKTVSAVFVFQRSVTSIYLQNGINFTVNIPFVVRRAWPLRPHGVLVQRVLEASELEEARITGEPVLPTLFTITSPFQEPAAVGLATKLEGGSSKSGFPFNIRTDMPRTDAEGRSIAPMSRVLKSIPPTDMVVWVSPLSFNHGITGTESSQSLVVTVDPQRCKLSIWAYAYSEDSVQVAPATAAAPPLLTSLPALAKGRTSHIIPNHSRRTSSQFEGERLDSKPPPPPSAASGSSGSKDVVMGGLNQDGFPLVTGIPSSFPATATLSSVGSDDPILAAADERMKATYWMERIAEVEIPQSYAERWRVAKVVSFDERFDGQHCKSSLGICFRGTNAVHIFNIFLEGTESKEFKVAYWGQYPGVVIASVNATRPGIKDLMSVTEEGVVYLIHPLHPHHSQGAIYNLNLVNPAAPSTAPYEGVHISKHGKIVDLEDDRGSLLSVVYQDGWRCRADVNMCPTDELTLDSLRALSRTLMDVVFYGVHFYFLQEWSRHDRTSDPVLQFRCLQVALYDTHNLDVVQVPATSTSAWSRMALSESHARCSRDTFVLSKLKPYHAKAPRLVTALRQDSALSSLATAMHALHLLGEAYKLQKDKHVYLVRLASCICNLAVHVRPEWADYWKRLLPDAMEEWPDPSQYNLQNMDDRVPVVPRDIYSFLLNMLRSDAEPISFEPGHLSLYFKTVPPFTFGTQDPTSIVYSLKRLYDLLIDPAVPTSHKRAENAITYLLLPGGPGMQLLDTLPLGLAAPLREAVRTCQLAPPGHWPADMFSQIGRKDLAASGSQETEAIFTEGYRPAKDFMNPSKPKLTIGKIVAEAKSAAAGEVDATSGVEFEHDSLVVVRFGQDRRIEEVARLLNSSIVSTIRPPDRPEQSEHEQANQHQSHALRVAERTLALSYGRGMFTFGSVRKVTRESHSIPKIEYTIKLLPLNITVTPETGKIATDAIHWGEFHNGVAAGLRISPNAQGVESSWITFNKPSELTPEHAGFLFALGLTGHLKELMTWHTFQYLTPKHDLTSIAVLLGLAASNIGKATQRIVKLLAVHTPALLPTPNIDLNVSLLTQASGLSALGLLYMGTKNRRMAEVCLGEISRRDLVQPDLSNEHREAYTFSAAIAFGMIMLGKGSLIPADLDLLQRLSILLHGDVTLQARDKPINPFDINLTSPAAAIALGLMYLKTGRQDVADLLTIPDTVLGLNRVQPSFLMIRTIAKGLIMWNQVEATEKYIASQIPENIAEAMAPAGPGQAKVIEGAFELAYYNIIAGVCFVIGLKFAGTARKDAYALLGAHYEVFAKHVFAVAGPIYEGRIKRAALREGLNQISLAIGMVMAGTGEALCIRRIRSAYGVFQNNMYHQNFRYGVHVVTMQSLGLIVLGGGTYCLGNSDAAIACLVAAFFPRTHANASDNKCYLQALRHLWVLAVEPRCLVARDVDTGEICFLPVKVTYKEDDRTPTTPYISPTMMPDFNTLVAIRVDTPRYWPFYIDLATYPRHREALLRNQTLYVKRRTAFLSYSEDARGSRSLFVRSGSSPLESAILDFPQAADPKTHPGNDLSQFITSFSNNIIFLAFADALCRSEEEDAEEGERIVHNYCHAALLDCIMQDKPQTLQTHLELFHARHMYVPDPLFNLVYQDMRVAADFYGRVFDKRFSGRAENNVRTGLLRDTAVFGALHSMEKPLESLRSSQTFLKLLGRYVRHEPFRSTAQEISTDLQQAKIDLSIERTVERLMSWYLLANSVPMPETLRVLRDCVRQKRAEVLPTLGGDEQKIAELDIALQAAFRSAGNKMTLPPGWAVRSFDEVIAAWDMTRSLHN